jgi:hypothetical protein
LRLIKDVPTIAIEQWMMRKQTWFTILMLILLMLASTWPVAAATLAVNSAPTESTGVRILSANGDSTLLELITPAYTLDSVEGVDGPCQQVTIPDFTMMGEPGAPGLAAIGTLLGVPDQAVISLEVVTVQTERLFGFTPCPVPAAVFEDDGSEFGYYVEKSVAPDPAIYAQNRFLPVEIASFEEVGFFRSQRLVRVMITPFQANPATGELITYPRIQIRLHHPGGARVQAAALPDEPAAFEQMLQSTLLNYTESRPWRAHSHDLSAAQTLWQPPLPAYRITTRAEGIYELTYERMMVAGLPVQTMPAQTIKLFNNGQQVAIRLVNAGGGPTGDFLQAGDRILFFGRSVNEKYTNTNVYWLTYSGGKGLRMSMNTSHGGGAGSGIVANYPALLHWEQNLNYVSSAPDQPGYEHWFGQQIRVLGLGNSGSRTVTLNLADVDTSSYNATLEIALVAITPGWHSLRLYVNSTLIYEGNWKGKSYFTDSVQFEQDLLQQGNNAIKLELVNGPTGQSYDLVYVDWIKLSYARLPIAQGDQLFFDGNGAGAWTYPVPGFSNDNIELYDITDPARAVYLVGEVSKGTLTFGAVEANRPRYLAQTTNRRLQPLSITLAETANLQSTTNGADYVIISHADFLSAIQPLADYRARQGYRVKVIDVQHIYDVFNYGRVSAEAIRDFLAYAYHNWSGAAPFYVLLVGDGTYDPKHHIASSNPTFIPPYLEMVDPVMGETAADNRFVTISGADIVPDINLGRFPAQTVADVTAMVEKTIAYEQAPIIGGWNRRVLFVTDNLDGGGGAFYNFSDAVAEGTFKAQQGISPYLPVEYNKSKLYLDRNCTVENCRSGILDAINQGALLISYVGHGTKQYWAEEQLLSLSSINAMQNGGRLPIMLPMTCLEGYYHEAEKGFEAFGEAIVRTSGKGAVASWSPTGLGLATGHDYLEKGFFMALFYNDIKSLGVITTIGKIYLKQSAPPRKYDDLLDTFLLIGDPALTVRITGDEHFQLYLPSLTR